MMLSTTSGAIFSCRRSSPLKTWERDVPVVPLAASLTQRILCLVVYGFHKELSTRTRGKPVRIVRLLRSLILGGPEKSASRSALRSSTDCCGIARQGQNYALGLIHDYCKGRGFPLLNALVVRRDTGLPGERFPENMTPIQIQVEQARYLCLIGRATPNRARRIFNVAIEKVSEEGHNVKFRPWTTAFLRQVLCECFRFPAGIAATRGHISGQAPSHLFLPPTVP